MGCAEQKPEDWWLHTCNAIARLKQQYNVSRTQIKGIGISYILSWIFTCIASGQIIFKNKISVIVKHNFIKDLFYALAIAVLLNIFIIMINKQFLYVDLWIKYIYITLISYLSSFIYNYSLFKLRVAEIRYIFNFFFLKKSK